MIGRDLHPVNAQHAVARLRVADNAAVIDKKPLVCFLNMQIAVMSRPSAILPSRSTTVKGSEKGPSGDLLAAAFTQ